MGIYRCDLADLFLLPNINNIANSYGHLCQPIVEINQTRSSFPITFWLNPKDQKIYYPYVNQDLGDQIILIDLDGSHPLTVRSRKNVDNGILSGAKNMVLVGEVFYWINSMDHVIRTERLSNGTYYEQNILLVDHTESDYVLSGLALWTDQLQLEPGKYI